MSVPVNVPYLGEEERRYLDECIKTGWISSEGPFVKEFEKKFSSYHGRSYGIAVSSGTAALDVAVASLGLGPNDEVILPTFTIISCASSIVRSGAVPVVVDCDPKTWNMDVGVIESKITSRTKAIMPVHIYGLPVDMDPVIEIAEKHGLKIIEDAAEAQGLRYKDRICGSFGDVSVFSFYPNKHVTTGEGGMVVTDDPKIAERCRALRNLCFQKERRFVHEELGWNYRMTNIQAALGLAQLERLPRSLEKKRYIGGLYTKIFKDIRQLQLPVENTDYARNLYWVYGIVLDDAVPFDATEVMKRLAELKIGTRPFFFPMHEQPVFRRMGLFKSDKHPVAERIARRGFYIPSGLGLTDEQINSAGDSIRKIFS